MHPASAPVAEWPYRDSFFSGRELPRQLAALNDISANFFWSWQHDGPELFAEIDSGLWERCEQNPRVFLRDVRAVRLWQKAADKAYTERVARFYERQSAYLAEQPVGSGRVSADRPAAYFCAEYGVHHSLPNYSGGLGILAGDHLKSASDLNIPLVAVGLLYRFGYFRQQIDHNGWQQEIYNDVFTSELAAEPVRDENGDDVKVTVQIRGRVVNIRAWLVNVGRIRLYLLDTNLPENSDVDRLITGHLYGGDTETRIVQEKVLGIGGVRMLRKLGISPSVFHLNEGHSAFLTLELTREEIASKPELSFAEAAAAIRSQCVFTTHTPVAAGNDEFDPKLLRQCFSTEFIDALKLTESEFLSLGRTNTANEEEFFGMTPLAIKMCRSANGVSEKHGEVSRELWHKMFGDAANTDDVPIVHVTNGVHPPTWIARPFQDLYQTKIGSDWLKMTRNGEAWAAAAASLDDREIWEAHQTLKALLIAFIRRRTRSSETGSVETINENRCTSDLFSPDVLTIGFARRVAAYKRWDLILTDLDRLLRSVDDNERPVQFVFAGKAHPQDRGAKQILADLMRVNNNSNWQSRAVFIEDYDQEIARYLVHGVDVWLNVPRRPYEASGTSGMKAAMNGVLNFSVLDGWWIEGFDASNGFAIGGLDEGDSPEIDAADAEAFYSTLENSVVPLYYDRDESGLPHRWIEMMRSSLRTLTYQFSSDRMIADYRSQIYER